MQLRGGLTTILSGVPLILAFNPYLFDSENNLRPDNASNLDYTRYDKIGSYYNGTLEFNLDLEDLPDSESYLWSGDICDEYINDTLRVSLDAVVGIQKNSKDYDSDNPFILVLWAWDSNFSLGPADKTANYSEHQFFQTSSEDGDDLRWEYSMLARDDPFAFRGFMANDSILSQAWKFNVTGNCDSSSSEDLLFSGSLLFPGDGHDHEWADSTIPTTIAGEFDDQTASIYIDGLFEALGVNTELAGELSIRFSGQIDEDRSDRLILDSGSPEWEPLLGFREEDDTSAAAFVSRSSMAFWASMFVFTATCLHMPM